MPRGMRMGMALVSVAMVAGCAQPAGGKHVDVTLQEWVIVPAVNSIAAGDITFDVENKGPKDDHEFMVIRTDLAPEALPTKGDGWVDEEGEGVQIIGEIETFPPGQTRSATFNLAPGKYVLICNLVEIDGRVESHYQNGMRTAFAVTG